MKTLLKSIIGLAVLAPVLLFSSCGDDNGGTKPVKPKAINITYKVSTEIKDAKLESVIVSGANGRDSSISKDLKLPAEIKVRRATPPKNSQVTLKAKLDKPGKVNLEILVDNKSVKKESPTTKDAKDLATIVYKF